jgi:hypothetical protein
MAINIFFFFFLAAADAKFKDALTYTGGALIMALLILRFQRGIAQLPSSIGGGCPVTQFRCASSGHCVNLNLFCDGRNDCGDNSDETAQCTHKSDTYISSHLY